MRISNRFELLTATFLAVALLASAVAPAAAASAHYEFADDTSTVDQGDVVSITFEAADGVNNTSEALAGDNNTFDLHIGGEEQGFLVNATVVDENRDGNVTVELNTSTAGQANASSYLTATGNDSVTNATQATENLSEPLDAGEYPLTLGSMNNSTDTATLVIEENETTTTTATTTTEATETTTEATEETTNASTTESETNESATDATTEQSTDTGIPGFGAALAVIALVAVAFVAVRE
ncbi:PGF-CTERM sorting domain-containing protein [Haloferax mediterranei ATCC 33500]|uniref:PGF-CTERM sorting domain-containing protein n=1 Tax=Haloferax mediterranei (strain ATCC 33500 / DSM 1411 / JCM 8866 / NBRC 14739 / NCIMB 2177 / R-4) TaxID=523841 RepID=I3R144_HALMT|nr:PGF-CTERM sorting domain-containing protein [Haloferax mediterranei]AFK17954.1 hypothetical protein HFX_0213 [Haloferax mediterranei ATCC 33500]AHZ22624.1 hypothetical protein BM92_08190 [Haloferax mediterranei ATCC 33500]EMA02768.1 hypothetical protein C439_09305 [Haloferax mediterranei ATCC 33500]MDX5988047.1 PGF-CTERM sorting domain-containing protein [Haloferax mediterranei ATCC 33500]QCQ74506.1 PGF-CTERM sorting domain-containing protein [Haloferax mediterranei ATCC 33500]